MHYVIKYIYNLINNNRQTPSVFWHCWSHVRRSIRPAKID